MFLTESNSSYDLYLRKTNDIRENDIVLATITTDANGNLAADESVRTVSSISASTVIGSISGTTSTDGGYGEDISFEDHIIPWVPALYQQPTRMVFLQQTWV